MSKIIKQICWMMAGALLLCTIIFHHVILTHLADLSLQAYSIAKWGKPLKYDDVFLKEHQLVIVHPRFEDESLFIADRIVLNHRIDFWKRQLDFEIEVDKPYCHFQSAIASQWEKWEKFLRQEDRWITIHPHLQVNRGTLCWSEDNSSHHIQFDFEANPQEGGYVKLYFDSPQSRNQSLVLQTLKASHGVEVSCRCERVHCPSLIELAKFFGVDVSQWMITSGSLDGELKAIFPGMHRPYLEGELFILDLNFHRLGSGLKGQVEEAKLQLEKNEMTYELNRPFQSTVGRLDIFKPASFSYHTPEQSWDIHNIIGNIQLDDVETALIDLHAHGGNADHPSQWNLQGKTNLNAQRSIGLDLLLSCSALGRPDGTISLVLDQTQEGGKLLKIQCEKLSYAECGFLQNVFATQWPVFNDILLEEGELNALIETKLLNQGVGELSIKQFEAIRLSSKLKPWNISCQFGQVRGYGKLHLGEPDFWQSVQAALHLEDGSIQFEDLSPSLPMTDIQAHLFIQQGHVEHSLVTLQVAGLKGKMDVEWGDHKQLLTFKLDGTTQDLSDFIPPSLQEGMRKHFYHNKLMVLANLKRHHQQIELGGTLHIQRADASDQMDLIHFGCELKKIEAGLDLKYVPVGWFHAQKLPLEKFLSPFIFRNNILSMTGEAEFKGSFDDHFLHIKYDADDLKIENDDLCIDIPHLHSSTPGQLLGSHQMNLHTYDYQGTLPIQSASYREKNTGLVFQDIHGLISFKNDFIRMHPIETCCEGVYFSGELDLDYKDPAPGVFDVTVRAPSLSGKVSQIQHLLAHLNQPSLLYNIPLEGDVTGKGSGLQLKFSFFPGNYDLQASAKGMINEGSLSWEESDMALKGIYMDVDYDHQRQLLEFTDIQGSLLVGKPRRVEEYLLTGHHIHFYQVDQPNIDIDLAIKDKEHELLRLVGHTCDEKEGIKSLYLNPKLSHLSCVYPNTWKCHLRDWSNIEQLEFYSSFALDKLLLDLKRFRHTGFLFLSHSIIDKISQLLPLEGEGSLALNYQPDQSYTFHLEGSHIKQGNSSEHFGLIKGSKRDKKWIIDQAQWDDWGAYAELNQMVDKWRICSLGLKIGQTLLLGLEGDWLQEEAYLKAKLKFCQIDLSKMDDFTSMQSFVSKWWPKGILNATGEFDWNLLAQNPLEGCQLTLSADVTNFTLRNCPFKILSPFQIKIKPHHHVSLENVQIEFSEQAYIDLKQFDYQLPQESIQSLDAAFLIPSEQLERATETLHHHFPDLLENCVKEIVASSKQQDELKGRVTIETFPSNQKLLRLQLEDGLYTFKKKEYDLKKIQLQISENKIQFTAFSQEERLPFKMTGFADWPACQRGEFQLQSFDESQPLVIQWNHLPEERWTIRSMLGEFGGCSFFLKEDTHGSQNEEWSSLQGQVAINFNRLSALLAPSVAEAIQKLKVGSLYTINGNFWINPDKGPTLLDTISFKGKLTSKEAILKGYQMQSLQADVQYIPGRLDIQNVSIDDPAGSIKVANCVVHLDDKQNKWMFFTPRLNVKNLRLNLLRDTESYAQTNPKFRSLVLKKVDFQNFGGEVTQLDTWQAQGNLQFLNSPRKNPLHTLFAIPAEIILRLGLDPHVLNPVTGIVYFNLLGDRFYLKRFKDMFSEGRGSKFYLVGPEPSWMDFDGNLAVSVRMKQYNLMFKIAELFTVSIQGNIKKPRYSLQKQSKTNHKVLKPSLLGI